MRHHPEDNLSIPLSIYYYAVHYDDGLIHSPIVHCDDEGNRHRLWLTR